MRYSRLLRHGTHGPWGDRTRHLSLDQLEQGLAGLAPPKDAGELALIVSRADDGRRETPALAALTCEGGVPGDAWARDCPEKLEAQITLMRIDVARLVANGQPLTLFGDNLLVDLDLSVANLPTGSRLQLGSATLEVTEKPHDGCIKFRQRFGKDALRLTAAPERRELRLRGIHAKVVQAGTIALGDPITVLPRSGPDAGDCGRRRPAALAPRRPRALRRLNADPRVVQHLPSPLTGGDDALMDRIEAHFREHGFGLWAVEVGVAPFAGFVGLSIPGFEAPFTPCVEIGWRLAASFWGRGLASEAARAALAFGFEDLALAEIAAFTTPGNLRSRRVMERIGLRHDPADDFDHPALPAGHPLRRHVLYRIARSSWCDGAGSARLRPAEASDVPFLQEMLFEAAFWRAAPPRSRAGLLRPDLGRLLEGWRPAMRRSSPRRGQAIAPEPPGIASGQPSSIPTGSSRPTSPSWARRAAPAAARGLGRLPRALAQAAQQGIRRVRLERRARIRARALSAPGIPSPRKGGRGLDHDRGGIAARCRMNSSSRWTRISGSRPAPPLWVGDVGARMTVIRLGGGASPPSPVSIDRLCATLDRIGRVRWVVGPARSITCSSATASAPTLGGALRRAQARREAARSAFSSGAGRRRWRPGKIGWCITRSRARHRSTR
jgi:RimJ/RimL family protein N-acetyltransferase